MKKCICDNVDRSVFYSPNPQCGAHRQMVWVKGVQGYIVPKRTKKGDALVQKIVDEAADALVRRMFGGK